ncbi:hypothetical protein EVAR_20427_1 [Eumeta japonica]|uniref:Uncharacterized protein n=1 Tax=Eumeta variegata TaxID=151549 RepID=A0A4C1TXX1_EUMVA|nr:hypothetical protein EVAR_20427_1 [Eumeta japonica]
MNVVGTGFRFGYGHRKGSSNRRTGLVCSAGGPSVRCETKALSCKSSTPSYSIDHLWSSRYERSRVRREPFVVSSSINGRWKANELHREMHQIKKIKKKKSIKCIYYRVHRTSMQFIPQATSRGAQSGGAHKYTGSDLFRLHNRLLAREAAMSSKV